MNKTDVLIRTWVCVCVCARVIWQRINKWKFQIITRKMKKTVSGESYCLEGNFRYMAAGTLLCRRHPGWSVKASNEEIQSNRVDKAVEIASTGFFRWEQTWCVQGGDGPVAVGYQLWRVTWNEIWEGGRGQITYTNGLAMYLVSFPESFPLI